MPDDIKTSDGDLDGPDPAGTAKAVPEVDDATKPETLPRAKMGFFGPFKATWRFVRHPTAVFSVGTLLAFGIVAGVVGWGGFNWALEITNTEAFCISCHEMERNVYNEYRGSIHDENATGVRATCPDCHVPKDWIHKVQRKILATNELYHHFLGTVETPKKFEERRGYLAQRVWKVMMKTDSRECRNCHSLTAMDVAEQEERARDKHLEAMDEGGTCIDCHKGIAHELPANARELEQQLSSGFETLRRYADGITAEKGG